MFLVVIIALAVAALIVAGIWRAVRNAIRAHGLPALIWRYGTGAHMTHGRTHVCKPGVPCPAGRWDHMRRHRRAGLRLAVPAVTLACGYGWLTDRGALVVALILANAAALGAGVFWAWRTRAARRHHQVFIHPMAASLARMLPVPDAEARGMIRLPAAALRRTRGELGSITLPDWYAGSPDQRKAVDHLIASHWPGDVDTSWQMAGRPKRVIICAAPAPPDEVPFAQVREQIERLKPGQVLLGLDRRGEPYIGDFSGGDDPHWGFSVGSGRGKSTQLCSIGAQILHQHPGASVLGIDPKMTSFEVLAGVPGVELANDPRDMSGGGGVPMAAYPEIPRLWQAIRGYRAMMDGRISAKHADPTLEFPASLLFLDELNMFSAMSAGWWKAQEQKGTPDIWMDIAAVFWMGRFVNCHAVAVGQRLDDKATGGIGLRDSLGLRGLAGFRPNQWKMLVGTTPIPKSQKPRGRWIYSDGQDETWVQNVYGTPQEIRAWAMAGRGHHAAGVPVVAGTVVSTRTDVTAGTGTAEVWVIGLEAGADHLGISVEAFKKRRFRAGGSIPGEYRKGNQPAWTAADLDAWAESDHAAV